MGSACCVAARDRTITNGSSGEVLQRNVRYSPSWSFRWENRGRVAGEEASVNWVSERVCQNDGLDTKYGTYGSEEEGSPRDSSRTIASQKSPISEGNAGILRHPSSDQSVSRNFSTVVTAEQLVEESAESPAVSGLSPVKLSPSVHSGSSFSPSPLSSQSHLISASSTPLKWACRSPGHQLLRQVSDSRIRGLKSPNFSISEESSSFVLPGWSNESNRGYRVGSSDGWPIPAFSELMATSRRQRWSFDSDSFGFNCGKITQSSSQISGSPSSDLQTCGICSKLLAEKLLLNGKMITTNELAVAAVLICGHVYHAECLESMTPEINKYDPACPVCTFGEKQVLKLSEKAMRMDLKARNKRSSKRSRNRVVNGDLEGDSMFDQQSSTGQEVKSLKMSSSSIIKSSGKPFLTRHFSFGSKGTKSVSDNQPTRKRGFFWSKSTKL